MELQYQFKPGMRQSREAHAYFESVAADLVEQWLNELQPTQYLFEEDGHPPLAVRLWAAGEHGSLRKLVPWMRHVIAHSRKLTDDPSDLASILPSLMTGGHPGSAWFIEILKPASPFTRKENNLLCVGLVQDHTVFLSAENLLYVRLEEGLYGMVVHGYGSWLIEDVQPMASPACQQVGHA